MGLDPIVWDGNLVALSEDEFCVFVPRMIDGRCVLNR